MSADRPRPIVAIDGPSGAGKSTVGRSVAARLGYLYIDTGAMYRAAALAAKRAGLDLIDDEAVERFCEGLDIGFGKPSGDSGKGAPVMLDGEDVSQKIRTEEIGMLASRFSAHPALRRRLTELQRSLGEQGGVVMEGRDIGTVVFPDAEAKFFLSASLDERARRRYEELRAKDEPAGFESVREEMEKRDRQDASREQAPLRRAEDAREIDSTNLSIDEVVGQICRITKEIERG